MFKNSGKISNVEPFHPQIVLPIPEQVCEFIWQIKASLASTKFFKFELSNANFS